jgi:hypothetical protein
MSNEPTRAKRATMLGIAAMAIGGMVAAMMTQSADAAPNASDRIGAPTNTVKVVRCVRYWGEARYRGPGYDHVVHVHNKCTKPVRCDVSTNVDPNPIVVDVQPKEAREVITRVGSPAREFTPRVACRFAKPGTTVAPGRAQEH